MKTLTTTLLTAFLLIACSITADSLQEYEKGNKSYKGKDYGAAITAYEKCIEQGLRSSEIEYNLGNACFKSGRNAEAILHYERALRMNPADEDTRFNLRIANLKNSDRIETLPKVFYERWLDKVSQSMNEFNWSVILIICFYLLLGLIVVYFVTGDSRWKRISFFGAAFLLALTVTISFLAAERSSSEFGKDRAVVMNTSVYVKSSPDDKGNDLFILHDGTTVEVLDALEGWNRIRLSNGATGWLPQSTIEII